MKHLSLLVMGLLLLIIKSNAQSFDTTTYYGKMNYVFYYVDKSQVATGLLRDYGIEFNNLDNYTGAILNDTNFVALDDWRTLYTSLYSSQINSNAGMLYLDTINRLINSYNYSSMPVTFIGFDYNYNKLRDDAITSNLLSVANDRLYDVSGRTQSPYETKELFAMAPIRQAVFTGSTQFMFRPELFLSNTGKTISAIAYDATGGSSYQAAAFNTPFTLSYSSSGFYNFNIRITYTDGSTRYSHTKLVVYDNPNGGVASRYGIGSRLNIPVTASKTYLGVAAQGDITIDYAVNNSTGQVRKPLIVVEGFDPHGDYDYWEFIHSLSVDDNLHSSITLNTGLDDLNDYDLIFLNYQNGTDYIQRNAYLLERVIFMVDSMKTTWNSARQQNVIIGLSMGGLVTRYALRDMEVNSIAHETRLFISHDAPHWGANVPVGAQACVQHLAPWKMINLQWTWPQISWRDMFPDAVDAVNLFNTPAAKQMMIQRYVLSGESLTADNATHTSFYNELNTLGWPVNCKNVTVANGSCSGTTVFPNGSTLFTVDGNRSMTYFGAMWRSLLLTIGAPVVASGIVNGIGNPQFNAFAMLWEFPLSVFSTKSSIGVDFKIRAVPASGTQEIYRGDVYSKKKILWVINVTTYFIKCHVSSSTSMLPLDNAPGGLYDVNQFGLDATVISNQLPAFFQGYVTATTLQPRFSFVPTVSSLAVSNPESNLFTSLCNTVNCINPAAVADFYAPSANQLHISYTQPSADYILQRQAANFSCAKVCPSALSITGDAGFCNTSNTYSVSNLPVASTVTWSANPTGYATFSCTNCNTTTLTKQYDQPITLMATLSNTCSGSPTTVSKQVRVGNTLPTGSYYVGGVYNNLLDEIAGSNYIPSNTWEVVHLGTPVASYPTWSVAGGYNYSWQVDSYHELNVNIQPGGYAAFQAVIAGECTSMTKYYIFETSDGFASVNTYSISPNPAVSEVTISTDAQVLSKTSSQATTAGIRQVIVKDNLGNTVLQRSYSGTANRINLNVASLHTGLYFIQVYDGKAWRSIKLMKQ